MNHHHHRHLKMSSTVATIRLSCAKVASCLQRKEDVDVRTDFCARDRKEPLAFEVISLITSRRE